MSDAKKVMTIDPMAAIREASRCLLCHDAPCSKACPAGTDPAKFIRSIRFENYGGAAQTIRENNILGGICARVCPYRKYCEGACLKSGIDRPIQIGMLQQFATDYERAMGLRILDKKPSNHVKIAVIGSGPAGLSAAAHLAQKGYTVTVFEEQRKPGGWLSYGIPEERLPQDVVDHEISYIKDLGVEFKTGVKIGKDFSIDEVKEQGFAAILIAAGLHKLSGLGVPGSDLANVVEGVDFLAEVKNGDAAVGEKVVVIGGGDVAIDCALTAKSLGASDVKILYRRTISRMPANKEEKELLYASEIPIFTGFKPSEVIGKDGKAAAVRAVGMFDNSSIELPADMVIAAIGQRPEDMKQLCNAALAHDGMIEVSDYKTDIGGIFACGDIVEGDKTVVYAVKTGKEAAEQMDRYVCDIERSCRTGVK